MRLIRIIIIGFIVFAGVLITTPAEEVELFSLNVSPGITIPVGARSDLYTVGGGALISGSFAMPFFQPLRFTADAGYNLVPIANDEDSLSLLTFGGGAGLSFDLLPWLALYAYGKGGYFYAFLNNGSGNSGANPWIHGGGGVSFRVLPFLSVGIEGAYRHYFGLYSDTGITLGTTLHFGKVEFKKRPVVKEKPKPKPEPEEKPKPEPKPEPLKGDGLDIIGLEFESIFPVFYSYYDNKPVGKAVLYNFERRDVEDIGLTFYVKQYMDNPKEAVTPDTLGPEERAEVDIYGLLTSDILEITEGKKVSALINLTYTYRGKEESKEFIETININNRNALTWDDDRKACAFVTAKDPAVMRFAKNVAGYIQGEGSRATNENLRQAMALHEALDIFGMTYIIDPTTPYEELSQSETVVDYLQFPKQTLEFKGGDCDDLSILYAALLESLGIETAFITIPGHIYMAFSLEMSPDEARKQFDKPDNLIFEDGTAWVPVEITLRNRGFLKAWQEGAKEWRENRKTGQAAFYPVRDGWNAYKPAGFPGTPVIQYPGREKVAEAFVRAEKDFISQEITTEVALLQSKIDVSQGSPRWTNKLGVLYARYGLDDDALEQFEKVLRRKADYYPAMINIGNIYYLRENIEQALSYYKRAEKYAPDKPTVLLSLARVNHRLENYYGARQAYDKLEVISPSLANRFAYLALRGEEADRARGAGGTEGVIIWEEE